MIQLTKTSILLVNNSLQSHPQGCCMRKSELVLMSLARLGCAPRSFSAFHTPCNSFEAGTSAADSRQRQQHSTEQ